MKRKKTSKTISDVLFESDKVKDKKSSSKKKHNEMSYQQAVKNMRDATEEIGNIIDKHPELEELLDVL